MKRILVLLSSYNGQNYIKEQLESICSQTGVKVDIQIRDDGSTDNTVDVINNFVTRYNKKKENDKHGYCSSITLTIGENIGYKKSFMELVYCCSKEYDYYAFADQDDIWLNNKLLEAQKKLENYDNTPALYYGMMTQVDANLNKLKEQQQYRPPLDKHMILFQNFVQGSTIVFNKKLLQIAQKYKLSKEVAHDVWLPILARYFGEVIGDSNSYILYRKHADAVTVKMRNNYWKELIYQIFRGNKVDNFSLYLLKGYTTELDQEDLTFLKKIADYKNNKIFLLKNSNVKKYSFKGTVLLKLSIIFNRLEN